MSNITLMQGDCAETIKAIPNECIDCVITSPPYDDLREYKGAPTFSFEKFQQIANELYRVCKRGAVVVWIVGDETKNGSESGTSFKQALYFKEIGFSLETMIWEKPTFTAVGALKYRYAQVFEYMFVLTKGRKPKTFHPIRDRLNKTAGNKICGTIRQRDGSTKPKSTIGKVTPRYGMRFNIWHINPEDSRNRRCHPAQFPERLVSDHISTWTDCGDLVFDPFMGSGTTGVVCKELGRDFIGIEISGEYFKIAQERLKKS